MLASGTKLIVVPAKKKEKSDGGIIRPDLHQETAVFAEVISVGPQVHSSLIEAEVVWFNPDQLSSSVRTRDGSEFMAIDEEAVLGQTNREEAEQMFGVEFASATV